MAVAACYNLPRGLQATNTDDIFGLGVMFYSQVPSRIRITMLEYSSDLLALCGFSQRLIVIESGT